MVNKILEKLTAELRYEKLSVAFTLEGRDPLGIKRFVSFSATVGREGGSGWSEEELPVIKSLVSKRVIREVYHDAAAQKAISMETFNLELPKILKHVDQRLSRLLEKSNGE